MSQLLRLIVSILFLLLFATVEREYYVSHAEYTLSQENTSSYQQQQDPCQRTVDFILTNHFTGLLHPVFASDLPNGSKFKCLYRLLTSLTEHHEQGPQDSRKKVHPSLYSLHQDAVAYYIYALRRILI